MTCVTGAMLVLGAACLVLGIRIRAGKSRTFFRYYRTAVIWRNAPFALIPFGVWLVAGAGAIIASNTDAGIAAALLTPVAFVALMVSFVWLFKPPTFMKPRWLTEAETGAAREPATGARRIYLPPLAYWGLWVATAVIFALFVAFAWSWGVLVGLGAAISLLAVHTPKKA